VNVTPPVNVGIVSDHEVALQPAQVRGLVNALRVLRSSFSTQVVLHHGCGGVADRVACQAARGLGWQAESHSGEARDSREAAIIWASDIIVAVEPDWGGVSTLVRQAERAGWKVISIEAARLSAVPDQGRGPASVPIHYWLPDSWR
jgi:hypothetical protein